MTETDEEEIKAHIHKNANPFRFHAFSAAELFGKVFPPARWVVPNYVTEGLTLLVGRPKVGKSFLALDLCIAVASGGETLGQTCEPGSVFYAALEDNERRLQRRMMNICGNVDPFWGDRLTLCTEMPPFDSGGLDLLREWAQARDDPRLIVIDVLSRVRASPLGRDNDYTADYRALSPIKALADELGIAVVVIHHTRKAAADDKMDAVNGTNGLAGAADTVLVLDRGADGRVTLYGRGRDLEEVETELEFDPEACRWTALGPASDAHLGETQAKVIAALTELGRPASVPEIAERCGLTQEHAAVAVSRMTKLGLLHRPARGRYVLAECPPSGC